MLTGNGMDAPAPSPLTAYGADADSGSHAPSAMMNAPTMLPVTPPLPGLTEHGGMVPPEQQYQAAAARGDRYGRRLLDRRPARGRIRAAARRGGPKHVAGDEGLAQS
jgi:hypothetical protein